ncbi:3-hydroxyacyl-ACP dehydratase [Vibrio sp. B1Z05]|uniref:ApeI family dehydratase n=1 Tax=Vibrio sp. B1Z05 TaxID=2654980 RepID=UPI00128BF792|nr:3-hydroxyacyl-ACP dehydratase [Vibrio sp. B1Z05]MPW37187.1 3-hydroxyacyl-ACP dehydratase [Vibrio sp. B1Z05]
MHKRKPTIIDVNCADTQATLQLKVDADILDFCGHFSHFPLLPGVSQIDWALFYAVEYLNTPAVFKGMEVIKFQEPILPDAQVTLDLNWDSDKQKLSFKFRSQQGELLVIHSSGKMKLGK